MRQFYLLSTALTLVALVFRLRYRIMNLILANDVLRKLTVSLAMRIPSLRARIFNSLLKGKKV